MTRATVAGLVLMAGANGVLGQPFTIKSYVIGAPGGTSAGKVHTLKGIAGLHDALHYSSRTVEIAGGFWSVVTVLRDERGPALRIVPSGRSVIIAWPDPSTGFVLQETTALSPGLWSDVLTAPRVVGAEKQVALPLQPGTRFFRLRKEEPK